MSEAFDPYHKWLGIPPEEQPASHYRLLGLRRFEGDLEVIESAADQRMLHLRTFQTGRRAAECQKLLNEVAAARVCLLNADQRTAYNASLSESPSPAVQPVASAVSVVPVATAVPTVAAVPTVGAGLPVIDAGGAPALGASRATGRATGRSRYAASRRPSPWLPIALGAVGLVIVVALLWILMTGHGEPPVRAQARTANAERPGRASRPASSTRPAQPRGGANREAASGNAMADDAASRAGWPVPGAALQRERAPAKEPDPAGVVAHWRLDDGQGTAAANAAGNGHVGTLDGGPAWSNEAPPMTGLRGSLAFDGVAAMVEMTSDPAINPTGSFSLAAWVKIKGNQEGGHTVISSRDQILVDGVYTLRGFILRATADSRWQFMLGDEHAWHYATSDFIPNDRWVHLVATFEQTETDGAVAVGVSRLFADGALVATKHNARYKAAIDGHPTRIGAGENEKPSGGHRMHGNIADVRIYHRLLSDHEIAAMCPWQ